MDPEECTNIAQVRSDEKYNNEKRLFKDSCSSRVNEGVEPMGLLFAGYNPLRQQVLDTD